jgi:hypothetical protein
VSGGGDRSSVDADGWFGRTAGRRAGSGAGRLVIDERSGCCGVDGLSDVDGVYTAAVGVGFWSATAIDFGGSRIPVPAADT